MIITTERTCLKLSPIDQELAFAGLRVLTLVVHRCCRRRCLLIGHRPPMPPFTAPLSPSLLISDYRTACTHTDTRRPRVHTSSRRPGDTGVHTSSRLADSLSLSLSLSPSLSHSLLISDAPRAHTRTHVALGVGAGVACKLQLRANARVKEESGE